MKNARKWILRGVVVAAAAVALTLALMPQPVIVDLGVVARGPLRVTADGLGRTRVRERFVVAAPASGHLRRIALQAGDKVAAGQVVAVVDPPMPTPLDARTRVEATARLAAARAMEAEARAAVEVARVAETQARRDRERTEALGRSQSVTARELETARTEAEARLKAVRQAELAVDTAHLQAEAAAAVLQSGKAGSSKAEAVPVATPSGGVVLRINQESEGPVAAGTPLLEVGDPASLEVVVDLPTPLAVQVAPGAAVEVARWGGPGTLAGTVRRVEPSGFTKISALGVEEQRVFVVIDPVRAGDGGKGWDALGDGFRVETAIVLWAAGDVATVPEGALFRRGEGWSAFAAVQGRASRKDVRIGHRDGRSAEVLDGLAPGESVILFPGDRVVDGVRIKPGP
jgi:HlyD family secretion protein